jgi:hypothetical protein
MNLHEYQRSFVRASLLREVSSEQLGAVGDVERVRLYRNMIRGRIEDMARVAFRETLQVVGESAFSACIARALAAAPPTSPLLRDVIAEFAPFARNDSALRSEAPDFLVDLLRFEETKWRLAYQHGHVLHEQVHEFAFERVPFVNPVLCRLELAYAVHEAERKAERTLLLMYRPPSVDQVRWYAVDAFVFALLERAAKEAEPFSDSVRHAAEASGRSVDEALVQDLASAVTVALERGVLLGSR